MSKRIKKMIHICIIIVIFVAIAFTALMLILRYDEKGESNMPFEISKITIISTVDAQDVEDSKNIWNENVIQNNDIYIDIEKNDDYSKTQIIEKVTISNFQVTSQINDNEIIIYRPSTSELNTFENNDEYKIDEIAFEGSQSTDIQNLLISNQGGRIAFRCSNEDVGTYISNEGEELDYSKLLENLEITDEDLQFDLSFDIEIILKGGTAFKSTVSLSLPINGVIENGISSEEITEMDYVFKRVENS